MWDENSVCQWSSVHLCYVKFSPGLCRLSLIHPRTTQLQKTCLSNSTMALWHFNTSNDPWSRHHCVDVVSAGCVAFQLFGMDVLRDTSKKPTCFECCPSCCTLGIDNVFSNSLTPQAPSRSSTPQLRLDSRIVDVVLRRPIANARETSPFYLASSSHPAHRKQRLGFRFRQAPLTL